MSISLIARNISIIIFFCQYAVCFHNNLSQPQKSGHYLGLGSGSHVHSGSGLFLYLFLGQDVHRIKIFTEKARQDEKN